MKVKFKCIFINYMYFIFLIIRIKVKLINGFAVSSWYNIRMCEPFRGFHESL